MLPKHKLMENWINEYLAKNPDGLDVTAHVFSEIGRDDFYSYGGVNKLLGDARQRRIDDEKRKMGMLVLEKLNSMFHVVETLGVVTVNPAAWPTLEGWVSSYSQHRVDTKRRKLW
ncbi:MAG TPA: hypothetical protein VGG33_03015 [Polyangia bacterium]